MPIQQSLFGGVSLGLFSVREDNCECAGGCGTMSEELISTPEGGMCVKCVRDLYAICDDCSKMLSYDKWGECEDLRTGPDGKIRCPGCDAATFSLCDRCGRRTLRDGNTILTSPDDSTREYCQSCWQCLWFACSVCEEVFASNLRYTDPDNSAHYCEECFERTYFRCSCCTRSFNRAALCGWEGDPHCSDCYGQADVWKVRPWSGKATTFERVGSKRCFGVELETERCDNYRDLHGNTDWGCVYECSTPGREFISPILQGDEGFDEIKTLCDTASNNGWSIDRSCGLHVHVDARDLSSDEVLQIAYAYRKTYTLWKLFVDHRRGDNSMCGSPQYTAVDIRGAEHIEDFVESRDRFEFINWRAYLAHGSIEVRLYKGSLNAREICNWVALHTRFIDIVKDLTFDEVDDKLGSISRTNWRGLVSIIEDTNLLDYWRRIAGRQGNTLPALWDGESDNTDATPLPDESVEVEAEIAYRPDRCPVQPRHRPDLDTPTWALPPYDGEVALNCAAQAPNQPRHHPTRNIDFVGSQRAVTAADHPSEPSDDPLAVEAPRDLTAIDEMYPWLAAENNRRSNTLDGELADTSEEAR